MDTLTNEQMLEVERQGMYVRRPYRIAGNETVYIAEALWPTSGARYELDKRAGIWTKIENGMPELSICRCGEWFTKMRGCDAEFCSDCLEAMDYAEDRENYGFAYHGPKSNYDDSEEIPF